MFQAWRYTKLPATDVEDASFLPANKSFRRWLQPKPLAITFSSLLLVVLLFHWIATTRASRLPFAFDTEPRPKWLDKDPMGGPLVLRVAVMSAPYEFEKREAIRETIFRGVRASDVDLEYRFFVGSTGDESVSTRLSEEMGVHKDIFSLEMKDSKERLSEKRYAALKWGRSVQSDSYDYFMTMDTDTFVRFGTLAKRLPIFLKSKLWWRRINPRKDPVLIARMLPESRYYLNTVSDGNENSDDQDEMLDGPEYQYPAGIAYMLSSSLVDRFLSANPPLPHHIYYPFDDVMIGAWIASLKQYHNPYAKFTTWIPNKGMFKHGHPVPQPKPLLPEPVDTIILDDVEGWHDYLGRGGHDASFSWNSVCVHHVSLEQMREFRAMDVISAEWSS